MRTAADIGMAGGAIALALVKHLIYKGDLTLEEAKIILTDAQKRLIDFPDGVEGARMLSEIYEKVIKEAEYF